MLFTGGFKVKENELHDQSSFKFLFFWSEIYFWSEMERNGAGVKLSGVKRSEMEWKYFKLYQIIFKSY